MTTECCCTLCPTPSQVSNLYKPFSEACEAVSLFTFSWYICCNDLAAAQPHPSNLPLSRIGLLWFRRADLQAYALHFWPVVKRWRPSFTRGSVISAFVDHLVQCHLRTARGGGEAADREADGRAIVGNGRGSGWARRENRGPLEEGRPGEPPYNVESHCGRCCNGCSCAFEVSRCHRRLAWHMGLCTLRDGTGHGGTIETKALPLMAL